MKSLGRWIWIPIVIVVVVLGVLGYSFSLEQQYAGALRSLQTQAVARGTITSTVDATGTLAAVRTADLSFGVSGNVGQVNVKLGDPVKKGAVLAALDPSSLPSAPKPGAGATAQQIRAWQSSSVNLAEQDLVSAQQNLQDAKSSLTAEANAEVAVASAQSAYDSSLTTYSQEIADPQTGALNSAISQLQGSQAHWQDLVSHDAGQGAVSAAYTEFLQDLKQLERVQNLYNSTGDSALVPSTTTAAMVTAQYNLAKAQLADAQAALKNYQNGVSAQTVAAAQARVNADEATIQEAEIVAPFDGTVTALNTLAGDVANPGTVVISLADRSQLHVDIPISELDISSILVGQSAALNFDAFPTKNYVGQVTVVDTAPTISSGSVTYTARVVVQGADPSLLPGMTAGVTIVTRNLTNVLVVPTRAVRTVNGKQVVYELQDNRLTAVPVQLGAANDAGTLAQVTGGSLQAGQRIVVNPPRPIPTPPSGLFGLAGSL
jgi:HlyD family secretion protein